MTKFRPCIDLHDGKVKQIVGSSLSDNGSGLKTNFETDMSAAAFAEMYKRDGVKGGHVIMLGKGNEAAAKAALAAYEVGSEVGGGITAVNAKEYLDAGASHVIVTSWIFPNGELDIERLRLLTKHHRQIAARAGLELQKHIPRRKPQLERCH
jgi:Phosphoribosylformimino-5-aminoimidazole carboxamide ribonucleotide (ProFAR) isomerase